jgi:ribonuclease BN (tRNA processing enzyme)
MSARRPLDLAFLGSGNAFAPGRCWSGFLLNGRYLFDAPPTALLSLKRAGANLSAIDTIMLSHFHADHFYGLPFLLLEYAHRTQRTSDLTLIGPPGIEERVHALMEIGYPSTLEHDSGYRLRFIEITDGLRAKANGLEFEAVQVNHGGGKLECFGVRAAVDDRRISYTGDTGWCDGLLTLASGTEVLVADCTYATGRDRADQHLSLEEIATLRPQIDPATAIILTHLGEPTDAAGLAHTFVASDLATFSFA